MNKRIFWLFFCLILTLSFVVRIIPPQNHNFFFTMDQADDAVWVREIFAHYQLITHGSRSNIPTISSGPLWYYWLSIGYFIFQGDPYGAVVLGILRSVVLTGLLMWFMRSRIGDKQALFVGLFLSFFWWFYDSSRWSFSPFPAVSSVFILLLLLVKFLEGNKKYFLLASIPVFFGFNFELAGASSVLLFYLILGVWFWRRKKISLQHLLISLIPPALFVIYIVFRLVVLFLQKMNGTGFQGSPTGYFSGTSFFFMTGRFLEMLSYTLLPYHKFISLVIFLFLVLFFLFKEKKNPFVGRFVGLGVTLAVACWFFFSTNHGWYDWHTVFIPPVLFICVLLLILSLPKKLAVVGVIAIIVFQFPVFRDRYVQYLKPQDDPGMLSTEIKVVNWIYANREGEGFNVYTYMPSRRDYSYQYVIWWWGLKQYGFLPCEYSISPNDAKLYVPSKDFYSKPTLDCSHLRFLIIEPGHEQDEYFPKWYARRQQETVLLDSTNIGGVQIQKRRQKTKEEITPEDLQPIF